ncbi:hypothetical protein FACS1894172_03160 [Spirochaetia bacterium]|nr:hypothetical protein FACS1894164_19180 [Spirochaetia bacterium]GHU30261.1 hypothetical protein FACS1894172_03160 [Spirochaetia bacterium]
MLYYHHDTTTPQILEGIDRIQVKLNETFYPIKSHNFKSYKNELNILRKGASKNFHPGFYYLNIQGEFIDHSQILLVSIAKAVLVCIQDNVFSLTDSFDKHHSVEDNLRFVRENLHLYIDTTITEIEFCFDWMPHSISIKGEILNSNIEDGDISDYFNYKKLSIPERLKNRKLIQNENTIYSLDYKGNKRNSTIKVYDRTKRLSEKNNEYQTKDINDNQYPKRIEFLLTNKAYRPFLSIENMYDDYKTVVARYSLLLIYRYYEYFYDLVEVMDDGQHPVFISIYNKVLILAALNFPFNTKMPKNNQDIIKVKSSPQGKIAYRIKRNYKHPADVKKAIAKEVKNKNNDDIQFYTDDEQKMLFSLIEKANLSHYQFDIDYKGRSKVFADMSDDEFIFFKNNVLGIIGYIDPKTFNQNNDKPPRHKK